MHICDLPVGFRQAEFLAKIITIHTDEGAVRGAAVIGFVNTAPAVVMSIAITIRAAEVLSLTVIFNLCRENVGKFLVFHLLYQGEHLGISSVLGFLDLASLCSKGQDGEKANCHS